jgi:UDP-glucose 4-epimerase
VRVLVSGGCGFLGRAFARRARAAGHHVVTLDRDAAADVPLDITDAAAMAQAASVARPDVVVHLAARLTDAGERDPLDAVRVNALGTAIVFAAAEAAGAARVVYASSNAAVGVCAHACGDAVTLEPRSVYGVTKAFGEHLARAMSCRAGAPSYLALRFGWIYGPGRSRGWSDPQQVIDAAIAGHNPVQYPDYPDAIDWTYVDDAADILERALDCPLQGFAAHNALGDRRRMADAAAHLRRRFPHLALEPRAAALPPSAWQLVNDGLAARVGAWAVTPLETGIDRMIATAAAMEGR